VVSKVKFSLWRTNPSQVWKIAGWLVPAIALSLVWVATRIWGVLPKILGDELVYSTNARWLPLADSSVPNYLFNMVFGMTNSCGYGFYTCGKAINMLFLVGFAVFIYLAARLLVEPPLALFVGFLALLGPISAYASYFTPDMMFYFGASIVIYFTLRLTRGDAVKSWLLIGVGLGVVTLIKPHALFLIPPIALFILFLGLKAGKSAAVKSVLSAITFVAMTFVTKFVIGFVIAGPKGLTVFGGSYDASAGSVLGGSAAPEGMATPAEVEPLITGGIFSATGWQVLFHVSYILIFFGVPALFVILKTLKTFRRGNELTEDQRISAFLFAAMATLVAVSAVFVAVSMSFGEVLQNRVMIRYYEYLIPFLMLAVLVDFKSEKEVGKVARWFGVAAIALWLGISLPYFASLVPAMFTDSSLIAAAIKSGISLWVYAAISLALFIFWAVKPLKGAKVWLYGFAPAVVLLYAISSYANMTVISSVVGPYTTASRFAHDNLTLEQRQQLVVIGMTNQNVKAAQLWIDAPKSTGEVVLEGSEIDINKYPESTKFLLIVGNVSVSGDGFLLKQADNWALVQNATPEEVAAQEK
jgi:phosphoglycerol transferase